MNRRTEQGFTSMWVLVLSLFLIVSGFAAIDIWQAFTNQRALAARADAAAAAGAQAIDVGSFTERNELRLIDDASRIDSAQGRADERVAADLGEDFESSCGTNSCVQVVVSNPPQAVVPAVTVTLRRKVNFSFFPITQDVTATSTASPQVAN